MQATDEARRLIGELVEVAAHRGGHDRRCGGDLVPADLGHRSGRPRFPRRRLRCLPAVEHHRVRARTAGCAATSGPSAVLGGDRRPELRPGRGGSRRRSVSSGRLAGDHADLGELGPHLVDLQLGEAQTAGLQPEPGRLLRVAVGDMSVPTWTPTATTYSASTRLPVLHRGEVRERPSLLRRGQPLAPPRQARQRCEVAELGLEPPHGAAAGPRCRLGVAVDIGRGRIGRAAAGGRTWAAVTAGSRSGRRGCPSPCGTHRPASPGARCR